MPIIALEAGNGDYSGGMGRIVYAEKEQLSYQLLCEGIERQCELYMNSYGEILTLAILYSFRKYKQITVMSENHGSITSQLSDIAFCSLHIISWFELTWTQCKQKLIVHFTIATKDGLLEVSIRTSYECKTLALWHHLPRLVLHK